MIQVSVKILEKETEREKTLVCLLNKRATNSYKAGKFIIDVFSIHCSFNALGRQYKKKIKNIIEAP
jgi:hypothetical protein